MRSLQKVLIAFAVLAAQPAYAQLAPHNEAGVTAPLAVTSPNSRRLPYVSIRYEE